MSSLVYSSYTPLSSLLSKSYTESLGRNRLSSGSDLLVVLIVVDVLAFVVVDVVLTTGLGVVSGVVRTVDGLVKTGGGFGTVGATVFCLALGKELKLKKFLKGSKRAGKPPEGLRFEKKSPMLAGSAFSDG